MKTIILQLNPFIKKVEFEGIVPQSSTSTIILMSFRSIFEATVLVHHRVTTSLAAVHQGIRVFTEVVKAPAEPPEVFLPNGGRHARCREQDSPQLAFRLLLELFQRADPVTDGVLGVARHAHHLADKLGNLSSKKRKYSRVFSPWDTEFTSLIARQRIRIFTLIFRFYMDLGSSSTTKKRKPYGNFVKSHK
jgi:hypothetical protein